MRLSPVVVAALVSVVTSPLTAGEVACGEFAVAAAGLDLAPPAGFTEICSQDAELCRTLTAGYPPTVETLGYFVLPEEWERFKSAPIGFSRYLIAQQAGPMTPSGLPDLKAYIHSQQGSIPDHTKLPAVLESQGRVPIGVFEDADDAIAFGVIMKLRSAPPAPPADIALASTNAALALKGKMLTLYAFWDVTGSNDPEPVKQLTREWLKCLRAANTP